MTAELIHRLHFAFTITFHYLFPQLTMGLGLLIVILKSMALKTGGEQWDRAARFWGRIFAINFVFGVVTGIPMEFEFGTNWARFSRLSGGVIGQPLAMEGVFSFFLESAFLGLFLYGEKRLSKRMHWFSAVMVFVGSWISGFFIIVTDAWMQHPVSFERLPNGQFQVLSFWQLMLNPWGLLQYAQHDRRGGDRLLCDGRRGRLLSAGRAAGELRPHVSQVGCHCRPGLHHPDYLSDRRLARQVCSPQPARRHGRNGRPVQD
jgi:cytochrome d ubiquinol oxidase subunit I